MRMVGFNERSVRDQLRLHNNVYCLSLRQLGTSVCKMALSMYHTIILYGLRTVSKGVVASFDVFVFIPRGRGNPRFCGFVP